MGGRDAYGPDEIRVAAPSAPGGWSAVAVAWDVLAGMPPFLRPPGRGWRYAALWSGPEGELRPASGSGADADSVLAEAGALPGPSGEGLGAALACLGVVTGPDARGLPAEQAATALASAGLVPPVDPALAQLLADRDFTVAEYAALAADGSGRLSEMLTGYPALRPFLAGPAGRAYRSGGIPAAARALSRLVGAEVRPACLRRLRGVAVPVETVAEAAGTLAFLARLPIDLCPRDAEGYAAAAALGQAMLLLPDPSAGIGQPAAPVALARRVLKALGALQRRRGGLGDLDLLTLRDMPGHAGRIVDDLAAEAVAPALRLRGLPGDPNALAREALFGGLDLAGAAAAMAARESGRAAQERAMPEPLAFDWPWPRPCPDFDAPGGCRVVPILSWRDLMREGDPGEGLDHCVGNRAYAASRASGEAVLLSVRGPSGERLATAEVRPSDSGIRLRQFQGRGGGQPPAGAVRAMEAWSAALHAGAFALEARPFDLPLGYDAADPAAGEAAVAAWRPLLRGRPGTWADPAAGPAP